MFEIIFRQLFSPEFRNTCSEVIYRLEKRMDRNEKMEMFLLKSALRFRKDPRGAVRFVFYFGICYGWLLSGNRNQEIEDLFEVKDLSPETKKRIDSGNIIM